MEEKAKKRAEERMAKAGGAKKKQVRLYIINTVALIFVIDIKSINNNALFYHITNYRGLNSFVCVFVQYTVFILCILF